METLEALGHQIQSVHDLQSVVKTMKGLAAVNIRQYERAVEALQDYNRTVELGWKILLDATPELLAGARSDPGGRLAVVVLGSDQGMCGQFNQRIGAAVSDQVDPQRDGSSQALMLVVGARVGAELETAGFRIATALQLPGSVSEIGRRVQDLLLQIEQWRSREGVTRVWLFHQQPGSGASYTPRFVRLLPINLQWLQNLRDRPWPTHVLPTFTMDRRRLTAALVRQYLFTNLYRALAESMASENAARMAAMQAAEKNVEERLDDLTQRYHRRRQNAITEELLDVTTGFQVLQQESSN
jgi:F-type H+-transporting ATPase subunit gamma